MPWFPSAQHEIRWSEDNPHRGKTVAVIWRRRGNKPGNERYIIQSSQSLPGRAVSVQQYADLLGLRIGANFGRDHDGKHGVAYGLS